MFLSIISYKSSSSCSSSSPSSSSSSSEQLLGDYDKVKTISSGSDCVCRCIVRPIKRSDCDRIRDDHATPRDFYTVETVTTGTDCQRCECLAPPSAVNPCEGEYRFLKLQEVGRDIKLSSILDLLEGSMYGMDLLKLHSLTTKLLDRMDNMESFAHNLTERQKEKDRAKERAREKEREKERRSQQRQDKKKRTNLLEHGPAAKQKEEHHVGVRKNQLENLPEQHQPITNKTGTKQPMKDKMSKVIRGVTFYMAEGTPKTPTKLGTQTPKTPSKPVTQTPKTPTKPGTQTPKRRLAPLSTGIAPTTFQPHLTRHTITTPTGVTPELVRTPKITDTTTTATTTTTTSVTSTTTTTTTTPPLPTKPTPAPPPSSSGAVASSPSTATVATGVHPATGKSRLSWTESSADKHKPTKKPDVCKDTLAIISEPVEQNSYGLSDGAWMKDPRGHGNVIYLTNGHYGNSLLEFRDLDTFRSGQPSNSYKLPYSFTGSGHVVYSGALFYTRAFSRDLIRYDLRLRYVAAWTTLQDAVLEEQGAHTHTQVQFLVDESGLWLLYPALDSEGFHQEVIVLTRLRPRDLQPIHSFRTGLRRGRYGESFLVCGVLYAVDSVDRRHANVTYAFDTHTLTHTVPTLAFTNRYAHTAQLSYCPLDRKLYVWDDGHQLTYDLVFAY
ncbi:Olfactomedin-like protein 2B [Merluccius polli]|uniref:Olfactomedin-like protein 2B n=1 Tax=Merluccius polli TaxID=89951 RepID=A0AA47M441_MERPO|nr:Olfactomedin-like protein 2B [Merluccius polli]